MMSMKQRRNLSIFQRWPSASLEQCSYTVGVVAQCSI
jgi:hypothetical protein